MSTAAELYGCVVVAQMPVQAAVRLRPALADAAVVVMEGVRPQERVCSVNARARTMGLCAGMSRVEVETFGQVVLLPRSAEEEKAAQAILIETMGRFTPRAEPRVCGADWECCLDLAGTGKLLGEPQALAERIVAALAALGFRATCAMAGNADAGLSLARNLAWNGNPRSATAVATRHEARALAGLPLSVLRLDAETAERFAVWGIETLGELAALPEKALIVRLGKTGSLLRARALGTLPHLLEPAEEAFMLEEMLEFDEPIETLEPLLFVLHQMLEQLELRAQSRALALASVTVSLTIEQAVDRVLGEENAVAGSSAALRNDKQNGRNDEGEFARTVRPAVPTLNRKLLLKMLQLDLEAHPAPGAVTRVRLSAEPGDSSRIQLGLFAPPMPEPTRFEDTYARLVSLVGEGNVGRVKPLDTHAAESFVLERFVLPKEGYRAPDARSEGLPPSTALRRMRPPVAIRVQLRGNAIAGFWFEGRRYEALRCYGPWRSSGDWWCGQVWSEDAWDVAACSAEELMVCVVGHDLIRDVWVMQGVYD
jgi:protein ImuB